MNKVNCFLLVCLIVGGISSCSQTKIEKNCSPGATQGCDCAGGLKGVQICQDDGMKWGSCASCGNVATSDGGSNDGTSAKDAKAAKIDAEPLIATSCPNLTQANSKKVDILFIVDNSPSMEQEQALLISQIPTLIDALKSSTLGGKIPNLHIGVISPNLGAGPYKTIDTCKTVGGDRGIMQNAPHPAGCPVPTDKWISYTDGVTNIASGNADPIERVKESFACISPLGKTGCGFEQPLEAARQALDPRLKRNEGFLRPDALLVIVFLTDEDDCSAKRTELFDPTQDVLLGPFNFRCFDYGITCDVNGRQTPGERYNCQPTVDTASNIAYLYSPEEYVNFFKGLKDGNCVIVAAIAGPTAPIFVDITDNGPSLKASCTGTLGNADPAIRLKTVVDGFGAKGQFNYICEGNFSAAFSALGQKINAGLGL